VPDSDSGRPTTTRSGSCARIAASSRLKPLRVFGRRTGSSGVASVPVGSETATPQRAEP
jgi:hypothetical protein